MGKMKAQVFEDETEWVIYRSPILGLVHMDAEGYAKWWEMSTDDRDKYPLVSRGHTKEEAIRLVGLAMGGYDDDE